MENGMEMRMREEDQRAIKEMRRLLGETYYRPVVTQQAFTQRAVSAAANRFNEQIGDMTVEEAEKKVAELKEENIRKLENFMEVMSEVDFPPITTAQRIISLVSKKHRVPVSTLRGSQKPAPVALARQECYYLLHKMTGLSLSQIGRLLKKDHTTVLHGIKRYRERFPNAE